METAALNTSAVVGNVPGPGMLFGMMLLAAIIGGYAARWVHVPRVVGFLLGGVLLRIVIYGLVERAGDETTRRGLEAAAAPLRTITDLALGLILFTIGGVFERSQLRIAGIRVLKISGAEIAGTIVLVFAGCTLVGLVAHPEAGAAGNLIMATLLALAAVATAPAATVFVLQEYESKGPLTNTILSLTGVNNAVCIVLFYTVFLLLAWAGAIETSGGMSRHPLLAALPAIVGSTALGVVAGALLSVIHARLPIAEVVLVFFALFILLGAGEKWLLAADLPTYNFLLTALVLGAVFANVAIDPHKLVDTLRTVGVPIFAGFFVLAGYRLHLGDFLHMGWIGAAYVTCRAAGKALGCRLGGRRTEGGKQDGQWLGTALLCQAAVVIGLASFVEHHWHAAAAGRFATVVLGSVIVFELIGPLLVKRCVVQGGEVKAITLLRRARSSGDDASLLRVTLHSLLRVVGLSGRGRGSDASTMSVGHIMRTNVRLIPASANFDEVLHLIERSTHSHFPVVHEGGQIAGVIHFTDVRDVIYDPAMRDLITAVDLADADSAVVPMDMPLNDLLQVFTDHNVAVLPVVDKADSTRIVGVVEQRDLLRALHVSQE